MFLMAQYATSLIDNPAYEFRPNGMAHIEATPSNGFKQRMAIFLQHLPGRIIPIFCNIIGMPDCPATPF